MRKSLCARAVTRSLSSDSDMISGSKEYNVLVGDPCASCLMICEKARRYNTLAYFLLLSLDERKPPVPFNSGVFLFSTDCETSYFNER